MANDKRPLLIIQFAKAPVPGQVKTRLQGDLGAQAACDVHIALLQHCCRRLLSAQLAPVELWVDIQPTHKIFTECLSWGAIGPKIQCGADLGERMHHAMCDGLERFHQVILVGSDCPEIDKAYLLQATQRLRRTPLVIGPAADGGYVLIAAGSINARLFEGVQWGEAQVYAQTMRQVAALGWNCESLPILRDVDRPADLPHWHKIKEGEAGLADETGG
ncbi:MAG: rSAM/selenodomain-associated transferase 1 [Halieaceae bacterium]|jgi:rSAM/selenodomain-associated transferase 1